MNPTLKSLAFVLAILCFQNIAIAEPNPHQFIDSQAQMMVFIIKNNQELYDKDPEMFKSKINAVFEPMVDFRRVGASVMGKKYYLAASESQRLQFIQAFKSSLLDTYSSTLAQWGDQEITTIFPEVSESKPTEDNWLIINIIVNGVNLGLTFRNQFQALAKEHNENIDEIIKHWTSDANLD
ncbi:MAG: ABC transporter substrate-binding protein [Proteobacteria bacterium]|nr:ABC transporter substrate-binding protein [Pseudomonadota bacterium]